MKMRSKGAGERRLSANHITIIAVAACLAAVPGIALGAEILTSVTISDPAVPEAKARVSGDGRLGVRGDVEARPAIPVGEFHEFWITDRSDYLLLKKVDPGAALAIGQITAQRRSDSRGTVSVTSGPVGTDGRCPPSPGITGIEWFHQINLAADGPLRAQDAFPIPLTIRGGKAGRCVYLGSDTSSGAAPPLVMLNGLYTDDEPRRFTPPN